MKTRSTRHTGRFLVIVFLGMSLPPTEAADIRGSVRSARTGAFLEAAEVSVADHGATVRTDREGRFALPNLPAGTHQLRITYPGSREQTITVSLGSAGVTQFIEADLQPADGAGEIVTPDRSLDVNLKYNFRPEVSAYVDVVNLLNPGTYSYNIDPSRVVKFERTGLRLTFGVSGRF